MAVSGSGRRLSLRLMEIVSLRPELHLIKPAFDQSYLWRDGSELTLVDTGIPGSGVDLAAAFAELGFAAPTCAGWCLRTAMRTTPGLLRTYVAGVTSRC
jgi:hypothetical protein